MLKHFCDRCEDEVVGKPIELDVPQVDAGDPIRRLELCKRCGRGLREWAKPLLKEVK